jgi:hypothetical protein
MNKTLSRAQQFKESVRAVCSALVLLALTALALTATVQAAFSDDNAPRPAVTSTVVERHDPVRDFNGGFRDGKADDCEQGFKPACKWLRDNAK